MNIQQLHPHEQFINSSFASYGHRMGPASRELVLMSFLDNFFGPDLKEDKFNKYYLYFLAIWRLEFADSSSTRRFRQYLYYCLNILSQE